MLYVTEYAGAAVSVFALSTGALMQRIPLARSSKLKSPPQPWGIAIDASGSTACVVDHQHHMLQVFSVGVHQDAHSE